MRVCVHLYVCECEYRQLLSCRVGVYDSDPHCTQGLITTSQVLNLTQTERGT